MASHPIKHASAPVAQASLVPTRKVIAGGASGALASLIVLCLDLYVLPPDRPLPAEIAVLLATVLSFATSYLVPPARSDQPTMV